MYRFWNTIIRPAFDTFQPRVIVEIGVAAGRQTQLVLEYCREQDGMLHAIDPSPLVDTAEWTALYAPHLQFHQDISLNVLGTFENIDAVLIDGDHNWYTVYHELMLLQKRAMNGGTFPVIFLHDIEWPYGRRDMYYEPERIPGAFRKAYAEKGMIRSQGLLAEEGGLNPSIKNAVEEHNFQNGVLTAVEDFLAQSPLQLRFIRISGLHGLGIILPQELIDACPALSAFLHALMIGPALQEHVALVEEERTDYMVDAFQMHEKEEAEDALKRALAEEVQTKESLLKQLERTHAEKETIEAEVTNMKEEKEIILQNLEDMRRDNATVLHTVEHLRKEKKQMADDLEVISREHAELQRKKEELSRTMDHLQERQKKWTYAFEIGRTIFRTSTKRIGYLVISDIGKTWTALGSPFPGVSRRIRHGMLGGLWPANETSSFEISPSHSEKILPVNQVTLCIALSGRVWAWPLMTRFLDAQTYPHGVIHLCIQDSSQDPIFTAKVREWLEGCDYASYELIQTAPGKKGLADIERESVSRDVADVCVRIYAAFAKLCKTPIVFFLEDDVLPPDDVYPRLVNNLGGSIVSVSACYLHRGDSSVVAWYWSEDGKILPAPQRIGVAEIGGNGFGCVVMNGDFLRQATWSCVEPYKHYDHNFYHQVRQQQKTALLDWSCRCRHYTDALTWR